MVGVLRSILRFVRSVLPADLMQLSFLFGVICLFIAPHVYWPPAQFHGQTVPAGRLWLWSLLLAPNFISFSGAAGYFVSFWPGNRPVRRIILLVCLPAVVGFGVLYGTIRYAASALNFGSGALSSFGVGTQWTLIGFILIAFFAARLAFGVSSLPLALPESSIISSEDSALWRRSKGIVWIQVAMVGPIHIVMGLLFAGLLYSFILLRIRSPFLGSVLSWLSTVHPTVPDVAAATFLVVSAVYLGGTDGVKALKNSIRLPWPESFAVALALPIAIGFALSLAPYLVDRIHWAVHDFGSLGPPQAGSYFHLPELTMFFLMFLPAFCEEIIFRGILQSRFLQRYGVLRGILLVSTVWAAAHYFIDFDYYRGGYEVLLRLVSRLISFIAIGFVLSWLTIKFGSLLPAAVAHTCNNVVVSSGSNAFAGTEHVRIVLWILASYTLFRYWPVTRATTNQAAEQTSFEPAPG